MEEKRTIVGMDTLVPLGAIVVIVGAVWSYGALWQKVENANQEITMLRQDVKSLTQKVDTLIGQLNRSAYVH